MLVLRGAPALSDFRTAKLIQRLQQSDVDVTHLYSEYVHLVDAQQALTEEQLSVLDKLLTYGPKQAQEAATGECFFVTPRPGTISPWSSKATDIAHNCGLTAIARVERGCAFYVTAAQPLTDEQRKLVAATLHDRMTESVFAAPEEASSSSALVTPVSSTSTQCSSGA